VEEWRSGGVEEWRSGGVEEWRSGGVEEWRRGGVEEWRRGGGEEWRSGGGEEWRSGGGEEGRRGGVGVQQWSGGVEEWRSTVRAGLSGVHPRGAPSREELGVDVASRPSGQRVSHALDKIAEGRIRGGGVGEWRSGGVEEVNRIASRRQCDAKQGFRPEVSLRPAIRCRRIVSVG
jgi:hypothetical protein